MGRKDQPGSGGPSSRTRPPLKRLAVAASIRPGWWHDGRALTTHLSSWLRPWGHTPHDLRRWFLSTLMDLGCPPEIRHDLVGHRKSKRDAAYERQTPLDDRRRWVGKIDRMLRGF